MALPLIAGAEPVYETGVSVFLNGEALNFSGVHEPVIKNDITLVPMRVIFEAMDAEVFWDEENQQIRAVLGDKSIVLTVGDNNMEVYKNRVYDKTVTLNAPPELMPYDSYADTTMVPLRAVSEAFDSSVEWEEATYTVKITTAASPTPTPAASFDPTLIQTENRVAVYGSALAYTNDSGKVNLREADGTITEIYGIEGAIAVAMGRTAGYALTAEGKVYSFGTSNSFGQLGSPDAKTDMTPTEIDLPQNIVKIGAGMYFAMALAEDGTLYLWGRNDKGQLGNGTTTDSALPIALEYGMFTDAAAGTAHMVALDSKGYVYTWGENSEGQLGRGSENRKSIDSPGKVAKLMGITSVSAGPGSSAAVRQDNSIFYWGTTYLGDLGEDEQPITPSGSEEPVSVDEAGYFRYDKPRRISYCFYDLDEKKYDGGVLLNASSVSCGEYQGAALCGGRLYMWGDSPNISPRLRSQFLRYLAMEYTAIDNITAVFSGYDRTAYALDIDGNLWEIKYGSKNIIQNIK